MAASDLKEMVAAVQGECLPAVWSRGVSLARRKAVAGESRGGAEWSFRVRLPNDTIAPRVILYPEDQEWDCDCDGPTDPCEHVAACAIMAGDPISAEELFSDTARMRSIRYEFRKDKRGLRLDRRLMAGEQSREIEASLEELLSGPDANPDFEPSESDIRIDLLLGGDGGWVPRDRLGKILRSLVGVEEVFVEGRKVRASTTPVRPSATVTDRGGDSVELRIEVSPEVSDRLAPGLVCVGDTLRPMAEGLRFGQSWEALPYRRRFGPDKIGDLVERILPALEKESDLHLAAKNLPARDNHLEPWIQFTLENTDQGLDVLPRLVYGRPPVARLEDGKLRLFGKVAPARRAAAEKSLILRLRSELNLVDGRWAHFSAADGARFLSEIQSFDSTSNGAAAGGAAVPAIDLVPRVLAGEGSDPDEFAVVFQESAGRTSAPENAVDAEVVLSAWRQGLEVVPLPQGGFGKLPSGWLREQGLLLEDFLAAKAANDGAAPRSAITLMRGLCEVLDTPPPFYLRRDSDLAGPSAREGPDLPSGFRGILRTYQSEGVAWLERLREAGLGAVLADDMGLGKTVQALCAVRGRTLVICPRSVIHNWVREAETFVPGKTVCLYHGPQRDLVAADLTLTTYATLRRDEAVLGEVFWDSIVLDEAQAIKNPDSQSARAAYALQGKFRLSLSGTPVENRLDELWSQMHFTNPGFLGGRSSFADRYEKPIMAGDGAAIERLRDRLEPFLLRRLKKDVAADLPPRTETTLFCELDADERALYEALRSVARGEVTQKLAAGGNVLSAFEVLLRLRQAACHTGLLPGSESQRSSKVEALVGALGDVVSGGHKALVFSQWTQFLDRIESSVAGAGLSSVRLDGSTRDRAAVVDQFQNDPDTSVFLISLQAGGSGLNLTAADHVFLMDPWWNPAVEQQAADRAHRIGQDRPVMVYRLVSKDTVEERVLALQEQKRGLADAALAGGGLQGAAVSRAEILGLLA